jgi:hypothetical protein
VQPLLLVVVRSRRFPYDYFSFFWFDNGLLSPMIRINTMCARISAKMTTGITAM